MFSKIQKIKNGFLIALFVTGDHIALFDTGFLIALFITGDLIALSLGWTHTPSTNWSSGGRRPTYWGCGGGSPRREAEGRLMANVPPLGKTFFRKSTKKSGMSTFGSKTKVVRAEILHILVPIPSRGDLYLTISRVSMILSKLAKMVPSPRLCRSGLVVRPPAWDPKGARGGRFDS